MPSGGSYLESEMYYIESDKEMTERINDEIKDLRRQLAEALDHIKRLESEITAKNDFIAGMIAGQRKRAN